MFKRKPFIKGFALTLLIIMVVSIPSLAANDDTENNPNLPKISGKEIVTARTAYSKVFQKDDGTKITYISGNPLHYKDSKGKWQDIDSSIEESTGETDDDGEIFGYKSHKNTFETYLPKHSRGWVQLRSGKYRLAFKLLTNNKFFFNKRKNEIQVNNIFSHCDLKITLKNGLLKEDIILNSPSAPKTFTYLFRTKDLTMTQAKDGSFIFSNSAGKQIFMIPKFVMYDSNNAFSEDIKVVRKKLGNNYQITVTPNEKWLNDSKRVYPVVIDPTTISIEGTNPAIRSRFTYVFP